MTVEVRIKLLDGGTMPTKATVDSAGFDCYAHSIQLNDSYVKPQIAYSLGFCIELPRGYVAKIYPRSSIVKTDLRLGNCVGVIDSDYRGEVSAVFDLHGEQGIYKVGDRVCQMIIEKLSDVELIEVDKLNETERGAGGYGSTGR